MSKSRFANQLVIAPEVSIHNVLKVTFHLVGQGLVICIMHFELRVKVLADAAYGVDERRV